MYPFMAAAEAVSQKKFIAAQRFCASMMKLAPLQIWSVREIPPLWIKEFLALDSLCSVSLSKSIIYTLHFFIANLWLIINSTTNKLRI